MSEVRATQTHDEIDEAPAAEPLGLAPDPVEVRRNAGVAALVGGIASAVGIAYLARATSSGSWLDWSLFVVMAALGVGHLVALVDARTPLLVADTQGVRIRLGRTWRGIPWGALAHVEHRPRRGPLRDGRLVLVARNPERVLGELDASGRRQTRLAERVYGAPFAVPLALSTRVSGAGPDLTEALVRLAGDPALVVEVGAAVPDEPDGPVMPEASDEAHRSPRWHDPRPAIALGIGALSARLQHHRAAVETLEPLEVSEEPEPLGPLESEERDQVEVASATPSPLRMPVSAARAEVHHTLARDVTDEPAQPEARELRRPGSVNLVEDTVVWSDRVRPIARAGDSVAPLVIDEFAVEPADDPVVGPELAAARTRLGLTVDQLADRTRIRPHVIESIEVDDFVPCGGDFYARGHLRTLARVLGVDVAPLLASYDERYADAPINPRRVFEAELATGANGSIRSTRGGPNWSVLIAAVMAVVLVWSVARLVMDSAIDLTPAGTQLNGSGGPANGISLLGDPVPVLLNAAAGGAHVVVRDGEGNLAFSGDLAFGESRVLKGVAPPIRIQSSDGALRVTVDGADRGALGAEGQPAQNTFTVRSDKG